MERNPHKSHTTRDRPTDPASLITPFGEMKMPGNKTKSSVVYGDQNNWEPDLTHILRVS